MRSDEEALERQWAEDEWDRRRRAGSQPPAPKAAVPTPDVRLGATGRDAAAGVETATRPGALTSEQIRTLAMGSFTPAKIRHVIGAVVVAIAFGLLCNADALFRSGEHNYVAINLASWIAGVVGFYLLRVSRRQREIKRLFVGQPEADQDRLAGPVREWLRPSVGSLFFIATMPVSLVVVGGIWAFLAFLD